MLVRRKQPNQGVIVILIAMFALYLMGHYYWLIITLILSAFILYLLCSVDEFLCPPHNNYESCRDKLNHRAIHSMPEWLKVALVLMFVGGR